MSCSAPSEDQTVQRSLHLLGGGCRFVSSHLSPIFEPDFWACRPAKTNKQQSRQSLWNHEGYWRYRPRDERSPPPASIWPLLSLHPWTPSDRSPCPDARPPPRPPWRDKHTEVEILRFDPEGAEDRPDPRDCGSASLTGSSDLENYRQRLWSQFWSQVRKSAAVASPRKPIAAETNRFNIKPKKDLKKYVNLTRAATMTFPSVLGQTWTSRANCRCLRQKPAGDTAGSLRDVRFWWKNLDYSLKKKQTDGEPQRQLGASFVRAPQFLSRALLPNADSRVT